MSRTKEQLQDNIASYNLELTSQETAAITDLTIPEPIYPLWHRAMNSYDKASESEKVYLDGYNQLMSNKDTLL